MLHNLILLLRLLCFCMQFENKVHGVLDKDAVGKYKYFHSCEEFIHSIIQSLTLFTPCSFHHSLPPSLTHSIPHSCTYSLALPPLLPHSLPHSLSPSLTHTQGKFNWCSSAVFYTRSEKCYTSSKMYLAIFNIKICYFALYFSYQFLQSWNFLLCKMLKVNCSLLTHYIPRPSLTPSHPQSCIPFLPPSLPPLSRTHSLTCISTCQWHSACKVS